MDRTGPGAVNPNSLAAQCNRLWVDLGNGTGYKKEFSFLRQGCLHTETPSGLGSYTHSKNTPANLTVPFFFPVFLFCRSILHKFGSKPGGD